MRAVGLFYTRTATLFGGVVLPDAAALRETAELLEVAERCGDDFTLSCARCLHGLDLVYDVVRNAKTASPCSPRPVKPHRRSDSR